MKILAKLKTLLGGCVLLLATSACKEDITDFGFDGAISGTIRDEAGRIVAGSITSNTLIVQALGEGDQVATQIRVKGDGTFGHTKLYPKRYRIWISGPVTLLGDTLEADLAAQPVLMQDLTVAPYVNIKSPTLMGEPAATAVMVGYELSGYNGRTVSTRELYCSTVPYPDASTGSGPFYDTKRVVLPANQGVVSVTGLARGTKYYIRIGAQAAGTTGLNFSEQLMITTP